MKSLINQFICPHEHLNIHDPLFDICTDCGYKTYKQYTTYTDSATGIEFVYIHGGQFLYKSNVINIKSFWMGKYPVTQKQWQQIMNDNPSAIFEVLNEDCSNRPVENVSYNNIMTFLRDANIASTTCQYCLPTESEWTYACSYLEDFGDNYMWYDNNSNNRTQPVGLLLPNNFGLYDMLGNVFEMCECLDPTFRPCIAYGGSFTTANINVRLQSIFVHTDYRNCDTGFRVITRTIII